MNTTRKPTTKTSLKTKVAGGLLCLLSATGTMGMLGNTPAGATETTAPPTTAIAHEAPVNGIEFTTLHVVGLKGRFLSVAQAPGTENVSYIEQFKNMEITSDDAWIPVGMEPEVMGATHAHWKVTVKKDRFDAYDMGEFAMTLDQNSAGDPFWTNIVIQHPMETPMVTCKNIGQRYNELDHVWG